MELNVQVMGYAQKITRISWMKFSAMVMELTRMMHQQISMTNMGTADLPAPLKIPAIQWENASRK